ncbi:hypothetical protein PTKU46_82150 [Paraburkholderia terrae]
MTDYESVDMFRLDLCHIDSRRTESLRQEYPYYTRAQCSRRRGQPASPVKVCIKFLEFLLYQKGREIGPRWYVGSLAKHDKQTIQGWPNMVPASWCAQWAVTPR